ncbi:MAG: cob(I)yrinic acid a,c-diamide adenosyltransferase [Actinomycetota bacterium]
MVRLTKIYTRTGDDGGTHLGDGSRTRKTDARVTAFGEVDEVNAVIGVARQAPLPPGFDAWLAQVQNDLFDLGADLSVPHGGDPARSRLRVTAAQVERLEAWCDEANAALPDLTSFVLPGGTAASAALHHARTVCRRAERAVVALADVERVNEQALAYVNRLSDLLFVLARACNHAAGAGDVLWVPGGPEAQTG